MSEALITCWDDDPEPHPMAAFAKRFIITMIEAETDPSERKDKILIAYQDGHITAQEAENMIWSWGLEAK